jgi:hypothetical protein
MLTKRVLSEEKSDSESLRSIASSKLVVAAVEDWPWPMVLLSRSGLWRR